jgi:hypothetical protein
VAGAAEFRLTVREVAEIETFFEKVVARPTQLLFWRPV